MARVLRESGPQRVEFDRTKSAEDQVKRIASTNARHLMILDKAWRERLDRVDAETREKERIQRLNERCKDL